jgi:SAM-dependent methyltransferase
VAVSFDVDAGAYTRFMGRFSEPLARQFAGQADLREGDRVLDVGCGPGALTAVLAERAGAGAVSAVDPSASFVDALHVRLPEVDVRSATAEDLPYDDDVFAASFAQLVVHFMTDPVAGLAEMGRVTRPGGAVAACVWDHGGTAGPLTVLWQAVRDLDPGHPGEAELAGTHEGQLVELARASGLHDVRPSVLTVRIGFERFEDWWEPFTLGVGPAGAYVAGLAPQRRVALAQRCAQLLPPAPFELAASAWCVVARA